MSQFNITFVTSLIDIYDKQINERSLEWRFNHFVKLVESKLPICLYISPKYYEYFKDDLTKLTRDYHLDINIFYFNNSFIFKAVESINDIKLPNNRNLEKDTKEYMILMNQKIEQIKMSIDKNPFKSKYFSWIDFSIHYIFKEAANTLNYLAGLNSVNLKSEFILIPGCWPKDVYMGYLYDRICWRFCGGFFIGDKDSLLHFYELYENYFLSFLQAHDTLVWEVNFWAWLEINKGWKINWFNADHNDTMCILPNGFLYN